MRVTAGTTAAAEMVAAVPDADEYGGFWFEPGREGVLSFTPSGKARYCSFYVGNRQMAQPHLVDGAVRCILFGQTGDVVTGFLQVTLSDGPQDRSIWRSNPIRIVIGAVQQVQILWTETPGD